MVLFSKSLARFFKILSETDDRTENGVTPNGEPTLSLDGVVRPLNGRLTTDKQEFDWENGSTDHGSVMDVLVFL